MAKVVLSAFPMIDPETYREVLDEAVDEPVEIEVAQLGSTERLIEAAAGADAVVTDIDTPVTDEALGRLDLRAVVRAAVGVDNVDVGAAAERGVTVTRAPDYCTDEVAIHRFAAFGLPAVAEGVRRSRRRRRLELGSDDRSAA